MTMARLRAVVLTLLVLAATAVCVRLGLWQLSRLHEKQALHAAQRAALAAPPLEFADSLPARAPDSGHRVRLRGRWDTRVHVLLSGRTYLSAAGVELVTPLVLGDGERVLVHRGWLPAADARSAHPERFPGSAAAVVGVALPFEPSARPSPWVSLAAESAGVALWSARALEPDSARARLGSPLAGWYLRVLPDPALPRTLGGEAAPEAIAWEVPGETMHLSYAIQWFAFALIIAGGSLALAQRRRRSTARG
jgi:cytochrome oxidase assembly protein ShyY1